MFVAPQLLAPTVARVSSWTPPTQSGLVGWYTAKTGLTHTGDGTSVTAWASKLGYGATLDQQGPAGPGWGTYDADGLTGTGNPAVNFFHGQGIGTSTDGFTFSASNKFALFVVSRPTTPINNNGRIVRFLGNGDTFDYFDTGSFAFVADHNSSPVYNMESGNTYAQSATFTVDTNYRAGCVADGTNNTPYLNGSAGTPVASNKTKKSTGTLFFGDPLHCGRICEVLIYAGFSSFDSGTPAAIDNYFRTEWGL